MDSFLTVYLKSKATNISKYLNEKISFIKTHHIISAGLIVHACALMNLLNNNYPLFILLFFKGYFITLVSRIYIKQYENNDKRLKYFYNVSTWVIILSTYTIFSNLYKKQINISLCTSLQLRVSSFYFGFELNTRKALSHFFYFVLDIFLKYFQHFLNSLLKI